MRIYYHAIEFNALCLQSLPWKDEIVAVGLARGIPNFKGKKHEHAEFVDVIERCRSLGWQITAHVGASPLSNPRCQTLV